MQYSEDEHAILTDLTEVFRDANAVGEQFGYDTRELKRDGRITVEEYDDDGEVKRTTQIRVRFD